LQTRSMTTDSGGGVPESSKTYPDRKIGRCMICGSMVWFGSGNGFGLLVLPGVVVPVPIFPGFVGVVGVVGVGFDAPPRLDWARPEQTRLAIPTARPSAL